MEQNKDVKKAFALKQLSPYWNDPSLCGINTSGRCMNITDDGKMCVAGKNYLKEIRIMYPDLSVGHILTKFGNQQSQVFIPESVDILNKEEWSLLQSCHDKIARANAYKVYGDKDGQYAINDLMSYIVQLNLFTFDELKAA